MKKKKVHANTLFIYLCFLNGLQAWYSSSWSFVLSRKVMWIASWYMHICLFHLCSYACYQALLAKNPHREDNTSRASKTKTKYSCHSCPPYLPTCGISPPLQVNFRVLPLKPSNYFSFVLMFLAHKDVRVIIVVFHTLQVTQDLWASSHLSSFWKKLFAKKSWYDHYFQ
jgi:hypothetical protein